MRISFSGLVLSIVGVGLIACVKTDAGKDKPEDLHTGVNASMPDSAAMDSLPLASRSGRSATLFSGPNLVVDSLVRSPTLDSIGSDLVVRVPRQMARLLFDSLPGFRPFARSAYLERVRTVMDSGGVVSPLSVAIGDFDGDSVPDLAMIGSSRDSTAIVMLVSDGRRGSGGGSVPERKLFFLVRPFPTSMSGPQVVYLLTQHSGKVSDDFTLNSDGVMVVSFEKTSSIYYLDKGQLKEFSDSED